MTSHGNRSIGEFFRLEAAQFRRPLLLNKLNKNAKFPAYVDVDEKFSVTDKLSMINTLLQMENVTSYDFMRSHKGGRIHIHAFWFDIYTGDIHIFSRKENTFVVVNEETLPQLEVSNLSKLIIYTSLMVCFPHSGRAVRNYHANSPDRQQTTRDEGRPPGQRGPLFEEFGHRSKEKLQHQPLQPRL